MRNSATVGDLVRDLWKGKARYARQDALELEAMDPTANTLHQAVAAPQASSLTSLTVVVANFHT
jgi:hypothetical protein